MKKNLLGIASFVLAMMLFVSCSKEGPAGATGPAGPTGAAGAGGAAGPAGVPGAPGTANVIYSAWLDVAYLPDTVHTGALIDTIGFYASIPAPKMTAAILNSGEIKVYFNINSPADPQIVPLPYFDIYSNYSINPTFYTNQAGVGTINLYATANLGTVTSAGVKYQQYRYVIIPGGVPARSIVNMNDYYEMAKYFDIKD